MKQRAGPAALDIKAFKALLGQELVSQKRLVSQAMIDSFAVLTEDDQFVHTDPERAAATPFGGTIAHGFLLLSLLSTCAYEAIPPIIGQDMVVNAGFDKIRFVSPCPSGCEIRSRFRFDELTEPSNGQLALRWHVILENIERKDPPILIADWRTRIFLSPANG